jgi:hypothetical protein
MRYRRLFTALLSALTLSFATAALAGFGQEQEPRPRIWIGGGGCFDRFSANGYALGVNIMIYAMTH